MPGDLTLLPPTEARVRWGLYEYHSSEVLGSEQMSEVSKVVDSATNVAEVEYWGDWDLLDLTGGLDLGDPASIRVEYDHPREKC